MPAFSEIVYPFISQESNSVQFAEQGLASIPKLLLEQNRKKLAKQLEKVAPTSVILLEGGKAVNHYNADTTYTFRQESFFSWTFGVREPDYYGMLRSSGESVLFVPRLPPEYATWMGPIPTLEDVKKKYGVTFTYYIDEIDDIIQKFKPSSILLLSGTNTDSGITLPPANFTNKHRIEENTTLLYPIISECRVVKSPEEIEMMVQACAISCQAHEQIMLTISKCKYEFQAESLFMNSCYFMGGSRTTAYCNNCSSGCNSAILHYGDAGAPNDKQIFSGDMCLFDMGASYAGYASDITISFPASGKFTPDQKIVYNAVLNARNAVIKALKPGVSWVDMHILANEAMLTTLKTEKLLKGDVKEMMQAGLSGIFQPHGLGHLIGLDVHDVGGYLDNTPKRPEESWLKSLRTARIMEEGITITVEPGCYFIDPLIEKALNDKTLNKFLVPSEIKRFIGFGGVRIEDVVLVTNNGCKVLSPLPRTVDEIESFMARSSIEHSEEAGGKKLKTDN